MVSGLVTMSYTVVHGDGKKRLFQTLVYICTTVVTVSSVSDLKDRLANLISSACHLPGLDTQDSHENNCVSPPDRTSSRVGVLQKTQMHFPCMLVRVFLSTERPQVNGSVQEPKKKEQTSKEPKILVWVGKCMFSYHIDRKSLSGCLSVTQFDCPKMRLGELPTALESGMA